MHIKFALVKCMQKISKYNTDFLTLKPHLNERTGIESKNYQIK